MPITLNVGLSKKIGLPDYGSLGASCNVQVELDGSLPRHRVAVFIDGCFWHGCPLHGTMARANEEFWREKLDTNRRRDQDTDARLAAAGWMVVRVWEHEDATAAAARIRDLLCTRDSRGDRNLPSVERRS